MANIADMPDDGTSAWADAQEKKFQKSNPAYSQAMGKMAGERREVEQNTPQGVRQAQTAIQNQVMPVTTPAPAPVKPAKKDEQYTTPAPGGAAYTAKPVVEGAIEMKRDAGNSEISDIDRQIADIKRLYPNDATRPDQIQNKIDLLLTRKAVITEGEKKNKAQEGEVDAMSTPPAPGNKIDTTKPTAPSGGSGEISGSGSLEGGGPDPALQDGGKPLPDDTPKNEPVTIEGSRAKAVAKDAGIDWGKALQFIAGVVQGGFAGQSNGAVAPWAVTEKAHRDAAEEAEKSRTWTSAEKEKDRLFNKEQQTAQWEFDKLMKGTDYANQMARDRANNTFTAEENKKAIDAQTANAKTGEQGANYRAQIQAAATASQNKQNYDLELARINEQRQAAGLAPITPADLANGGFAGGAAGPAYLNQFSAPKAEK